MKITYVNNPFLVLLVEVKNKIVRERLYKYFFDHKIGTFILREDSNQ